tara:strand:- start:1369 stop:2331 length:963 start_codon:yes stop_codon:yes gene_type:complete
MNKNIAIIAGEPRSINSEIIAKSWRIIKKNQKKNIFVIGNFVLLKKQLSILKIKIPIKKINNINTKSSIKYLKVFDVPFKFKKPFEKKNKETSRYILKCFDIAHNLAMKKLIKGFINCSIDKKNTFGKKNMGVTEFLAKKNKIQGKEIMLIFNKNLSVVPLTTHIAIKNVAKKISYNFIKNKIYNLNAGYFSVFKKKPRIAVLGLNPHNGEHRPDTEEEKIIIPVIKFLKKNKYKINGPFSSDTFFASNKNVKYDIILGMYHDQVLTPFKTIFKFDACNITLGLKYLRVSPDHGTGEDIIGKKKANPLSLIKSIDFISNI